MHEAYCVALDEHCRKQIREKFFLPEPDASTATATATTAAAASSAPPMYSGKGKQAICPGDELDALAAGSGAAGSGAAGPGAIGH